MSIALTDQAKLEGYLLVRRAAKKRRCFVADFFARSGSEKWRPAEGCTPVIDKGDIYLEYLGEAAAYESGTRFVPLARSNIGPPMWWRLASASRKTGLRFP